MSYAMPIPMTYSSEYYLKARFLVEAFQAGNIEYFGFYLPAGRLLEWLKIADGTSGDALIQNHRKSVLITYEVKDSRVAHEHIRALKQRNPFSVAHKKRKTVYTYITYRHLMILLNQFAKKSMP